MSLDPSFVGRTYGPSGPYEVGREHVRSFADAIGETSPLCRDVDVARAAGHADVVAPPTFLTVLGFRYAEDSPVADPALGLDYTRVVHGEQSFTSVRPVVAGDRLRTTTTVTDVRTAGRHEMLTTVASVVDADGQPVAEMRSTIVSRGTAAPRAGGDA